MENCALSLMKRRHRKKEEFAALDVDYRKILEFVEAGTLVRIKTVIIPTGSTVFRGRTDRTAVSGCASVHGKCALCVWIYPGKPYGWHLAVDKIHPSRGLRWIIRK